MTKAEAQHLSSDSRGPQSQVRPRNPYHGLWVALENCRYDGETKKPVEGDIVDSDEDFAALHARMRKCGRCACAIVFCDDTVSFERSSERGEIQVLHA